MIARGHLDVKVAVPYDGSRKPIPTDNIFHEKADIIKDGQRIRLLTGHPQQDIKQQVHRPGSDLSRTNKS